MTTGRRVSLGQRCYRALLRLLPRDVRRKDGQEMEDVFGQLWAEPRSPRRRAAFFARTMGALLRVVVVEWSEVVDLGGGRVMTGWGRHIRYSMRALAKAPSFTVTAVLLIGLGVGAVTTIFTVFDHVLLRSLPYPEAERLVTVQMGSHSKITYDGFHEARSVEEWAAGFNEDSNLTGEGDPIRIQVANVSEQFFDILGARAARGRLFVDDDFQRRDIGVIMHGSWVRLFGQDEDLVGRTIEIDGAAIEIVGVVHEGFEPPLNIVRANVDVLRPIDWSEEGFLSPGYHVLEVVGRLAPGATVEGLQVEMDALAVRLGEAYPDNYIDREGNPFPKPAVVLQDATTQRVRGGLELLMGAVSLLLLVACLNVAHLFLARGLGRVQELSVRRALGAGWAGITRQLLTESLLVGLAGGVLGVGLAVLGLEAYLALNPEMVPRSEVVGVDLRVLGFAIAVSAGTAVLFGLVPGLRVVGSELVDGLKGRGRASTSSRGATRLRSALVVGEVALSLVLVAQAGLLLKSFANMQSERVGFDPGSIWTVPLTPTQVETPEQYVQEMEGVRLALSTVPQVEVATYGLTQPFEFVGGGRCCWSTRLEVDGVVPEDVRVMLQPIAQDYFDVLGLPLLRGSVWAAGEADSQPTPTVLSESLAIAYFGSVDEAMGRTFGDPDGMELRVTGVVGDVPHYGLDQEIPTSAYVPVAIVPFTIPMAHMAVRLAGPAPVGIERALREAVWSAAPSMPVPTVRPMDEWLSASMAGRRFDSALYGAFGVAGLLLAAAGLYGSLLYTVRQRRRELGIRLALGAPKAKLQRDVVSRGVGLTLAGAIIGVVTAYQVGRVNVLAVAEMVTDLESRLYGVEANDPVSLGGAALVLLAAAFVASWLPARRAAGTDPLLTLKAE